MVLFPTILHDILPETSGLTENFGESFLNSYGDLTGVH